MIEKRNPLALDALVDGKVIVDDGFWVVAKGKFEDVKKRYELVKEPKRWVSMRMKRGFFGRAAEITIELKVSERFLYSKFCGHIFKISNKEKDIFKLTNQRYPIYKLFEKLLRKENADNTISIISKLIPFLYEIRTDYVVPFLVNYKRTLIREYKMKALSGELDSPVLKKEIYEAKENEEEIEKIIKKAVAYNVEHIMPVLIFRIRKLINENTSTGKLYLNVPNDEIKKTLFKSLIETIYDSYVIMKLKGLPSSLTTVVRESDFYDFGREAYKVLLTQNSLIESDYIEKNKHII